MRCSEVLYCRVSLSKLRVQKMIENKRVCLSWVVQIKDYLSFHSNSRSCGSVLSVLPVMSVNNSDELNSWQRTQDFKLLNAWTISLLPWEDFSRQHFLKPLFHADSIRVNIIKWMSEILVASDLTAREKKEIFSEHVGNAMIEHQDASNGKYRRKSSLRKECDDTSSPSRASSRNDCPVSKRMSFWTRIGPLVLTFLADLASRRIGKRSAYYISTSYVKFERWKRTSLLDIGEQMTRAFWFKYSRLRNEINHVATFSRE